jgi:hypothetical protein
MRQGLLHVADFHHPAQSGVRKHSPIQMLKVCAAGTNVVILITENHMITMITSPPFWRMKIKIGLLALVTFLAMC